jgi:hypothetical protein
MFERSIARDEVLSAVKLGELIDEYPDDEPFPSFLLLARVRERVLHLVVAQDPQSRQCYLVTVYAPNPDLWELDFRTRRTS